MSYQLIQIFELENLQRLSTYIEQSLTKQGTLDDNKQSYLEQFKEQANNYLQNKNYISMLQLFFDARQQLKLDNKFLQSIPALASYFIQQSNQKDQILQAFINLIDKDTQQSVNSKLNLYGILFNGLDKEPNIQLELLKEIINFSKKNDKLSVLNNTFVNLDDLTQSWKTSNEKKQNLYQHIINALDKQKYQEIKCKLIIKYLQVFTFTTNDDYEFLKKSVLYLILQGQILAQYNNIFESSGLKYLERNNNDLYQVFQFFITGNIQGYLEFKKTKPDLLKLLDINEEQYSEKVRVQSIGRITKSGEIISYKDFAQKLQISENDVENWVILAIMSKVVDAEIDQFNKAIYIKNNHGKYFDQKEWEKINDQLQTLIQKVQNCIHNLEQQPQ